ncbi:hypothetical protein ACWEKM_45910 [Streptomyces sp. NPDC004752]
MPPDYQRIMSVLESEAGREGMRCQQLAAATAESTIVAALSEHDWDVIVIGGGIRKPEPLLPLFEQVVNLVRRHAPKAAIAFNTSGGDSLEAAKRWL